MIKEKLNKSTKRISLFLIVTCILLISLGFLFGDKHAYADDAETPLSTQEVRIPIKSYELRDNTGYKETSGSYGQYPLGKSLINLSVYTENEFSHAKIETAQFTNYSGYGITGSSAQIKLSYNFSNPEELYKINYSDNHKKVYSISNDSFQSVGDFENIGVVGTGAMLFQKKTTPNGNWEWQTSDGDTKKQLHTFSFTDTVKLKDYANNKYTLYTPSGEDLSTGIYVKITFAYEIKITETIKSKVLLWDKTKTKVEYINMIETAEFYIVQNSGEVLFHNATNYNNVGGDESESTGAITAGSFETILDKDATLNGFRLDTLGIEAYDITYSHNFGNPLRAQDGQYFFEHGRYDFTIRRKIGAPRTHTIFVDKREVNDAVVGYFGQSLFTPDSQRVYTTGDYPTYVAGAKINLNETDGKVIPVVGILSKVNESGENIAVREIKQNINRNYVASRLNIAINEAGTYRAEFWSNPKHLTDEIVSGDLYHFVFNFEIVESTSAEPSINEAYLNSLIAFSDLPSKYYSVALQTAGTGKAIYAFSDYNSAYNFAYKLEREKIISVNGKYEYNGKSYSTQKEALTAINEIASSNVVARYFDATNPESYQTADIIDEDLSKLNYAKDVIVFTGDDEQFNMQAGLPSLNNRKYRYISAVTGEAEEGSLPFAFVRIDDFESKTVKLTNTKTIIDYNIEYDVSVEYQLALKNAPSGIYTVTETNAYGQKSVYDAVYIKEGEMTGTANISLFRNGEFEPIKIDKGNANNISDINGFILNSFENEIDPYSIVKITHSGKTDIYTFSEISDMYFADGGVYDFVMVDRQGNTLAFTLIITDPVGFANINLEIEQSDVNISDENIITEHRVFVGQEIELPTPTLASELFVFDGWIYNDTLIANGKFRPTVSGALHLWPQVSQKYTYLTFDSNGGAPIEGLKVEIGVPLNLPVTTKDGWEFGGWQYGSHTYNGTFKPTTISPTFVAVWHYVEPKIDLYDGNLYQTITANVGEKVLLPFPTRIGYSFFGWRQELSDGTIKVYYGQITKLDNVKSVRLDALWIRNSEIQSSDLDSGVGTQIYVHFIDEKLLSSDSILTVAGANILLPQPKRAGYTFVGWAWRMNSVSGKIYSGNDMVIPDTTGNQLVLEALWIAKPTSTTVATGTTTNGAGLFSALGGLTSKSNLAVLTLLASIVCIAFITRANKKRLTVAAFKKRNTLFAHIAESLTNSKKAIANNLAVENNKQPLVMAIGAAPSNNISVPCSSFNEHKVKKSKIPDCIKYGIATVVTAAILVFVLSIMSAFGNYGYLGVFQSKKYAINNDASNTVAQVSQTELFTINDDQSNNGYNQSIDNSSRQGLSKEAVQEKFESNNELEENSYTLDLTDDELFLFYVLMLDLSDLGYISSFGSALLPNNEKVFGISYTNVENIYTKENSDKKYIGSGFISFPRQKSLKNINEDIRIISSFEVDENEPVEDFTSILSFTDEFGPYHYVADGKYVVYSVKDSEVTYEIKEASEENYNKDYGLVYSYDDESTVYDPNIGRKESIKATSLNTLLDPVIAKNEYNSYIAQQTANGFTVDTMNFVYISCDALSAYMLNGQDESYLGFNVQDFYDMERTVGANEYYTVDADGNLTKLDFPPKEEEKASWMERLASAVLAVGAIFVGVVIIGTVSAFSCGAATAIAPYVMGSVIGGGVEFFMQTVVQGKKLKDVNWTRVSIAAVSGALAAIPGLGWVTSCMLDGVTEAVLTALDGGSFNDVLTSFTVGFVTGAAIHGVSKAVQKMKFCFVAGTPIVLASGSLIAIENIKAGDYVKSYNEITNKVENKRVKKTFVNETDELVVVQTNDNQIIKSTPGHKFFANNSWVSAENLRAGDILVSVNGQKVIVEKVQHEILDCPIKVYNFEVADNHTYFVGSYNAIAVHNASCYFGKNTLTDKYYTGRTDREVPVRLKEHARNSNKNRRVLVDVVKVDGLTHEESQIMEQRIMDAFQDFLDNRRRGLVEGSPLLSQEVSKEFMKKYKKFVKDINKLIKRGLI